MSQTDLERDLLMSLKKIATYKTSGPHRPGQLKAEHRAMITEARNALERAAEKPS